MEIINGNQNFYHTGNKPACGKAQLLLFQEEISDGGDENQQQSFV